ncbi:Ig domain-containing protein [Paenibacillus tarimensis]
MTYHPVNLETLVPVGNITLSKTDEGLVMSGANDTGVAIYPTAVTIPAKIDLTAKTDSTNIRLKYGSGQVILNWECNMNELRVHDPIIGTQYGIAGKGKIPRNEFVHISWIIDHRYMLLLVDGEVRLFRENEPYMELIKAGISELPECMVGVAPAWGSVITVKEINISKWNHDDNSGHPLALLISKPKLTLPLGESITLESRVFPETAVNRTVTWSSDREIIDIIECEDGTLKVTGQQLGSAIITGVTGDGNKTAVCKVKCVQPNFTTNLTGLKTINGDWSEEDNGMVGEGAGDCFIVSNVAAADLTYEADLSIEEGIAAALVFRATADASGFYCANIDISGFVKLWRPGKDIAVKHTEISRKKLYHLKVIASGDHIQVFLDNKQLVDVRDTAYSNGLLGLNIFYATGVFQNVNYKA